MRNAECGMRNRARGREAGRKQGAASAEAAGPGDPAVRPPLELDRDIPIPHSALRSPHLDVLGLRFGYGERQVLRDVSLQVARGEFVGLLGANGSGKSTLLRLIGGVLRPSAGEVRLGGRPVGELSRRALAQLVAVVPQSPTLPDAFTVAELVLLGRTPHLRAFQS